MLTPHVGGETHKSNKFLQGNYATRYTQYQISQEPKAVTRSRLAQSMANTASGLKLVTQNKQSEHSSGKKMSPKESSVSIPDVPVSLSFEDIERMNEEQAKQLRRK